MMKLKIECAFVVMLFFVFQVKGQLMPQDAVKGMVRGINIGNTMEPPTEGTWGNGPVTAHAFKDYKNAGFTAIRIPITWDLHTATTAPYKIDETWMKHVEQVVDDGLSNGLYIIINAHHEAWIKESFSAINVQRFDSIWSQVATRFKGRSDHLLFEILNEPYPMTLANLNSLNKQVLPIIRKTNPTRIVAFSGTVYSNSAELLAATIPNTADKYLLGYYHSYDPYPFGLVGTGSYGTDADITTTKTKFDQITAWSVSHAIPVILGEFGYMKGCDYNSRMCAYATAVDQALAHGVPSFAWDDNGDFPIYNRITGGFNEIKDILIHTYRESPYKMKISTLSDTLVKIQWTNRTAMNDSIVVERKTDAGNFTFLAKISPTASQYTDLTTSTGKAFYYRLRTRLNDSIEIQSYPVMMRILPTHRSPFTGKATEVPGIVQFENYDVGGEGLTFHDTDAINQGGSTYHGTDGVDIGEHAAGKYHVGYVATGEWLEYTINVATAGSYALTAYAASTNSGGQFTLQFKNGTVPAFVVNSTGSWSTFLPITKNFLLQSGEQVMRMNITAVPAFDLDYVVLSPLTAVQQTDPDGVSVYPNPAVDNVFISGLTDAAKVSIYSLCGILVVAKTVSGSDNAIPIKNLAEGVYVLKIAGENASMTKKIQKVNI